MTATGLFVGLATLDVMQQVDRLPGRNEKTTANRTWLAAGGPAAVAAIAFAALGGRPRLWTALGQSPAARLAADDLARAGVEVIDAAPAGFELAVSTALVDAATGERAVVSGSGHAPELDGAEAPDLTGVDVILVDGHHPALARAAANVVIDEPGVPFLRSRLASSPRGTSVSLSPDPPTTLAELDEARSIGGSRLDHPVPEEPRGTGGLLDHPVPEEPRGTSGVTKGPPLVVDAGSHKPVFDDLFPLATDVICSGDYRHLAGFGPSELLGMGPELVAVSHGGEPLQWWTADSSGSIPAPQVAVADTLGAGDVLHGAYCYWLACGLERPEALQRAVGSATERVRHLGPFAWRGALSTGLAAR